jgi:hypothetical protein
MTLRLPTRAFAPVLALAILGGIVASFMVYRTMPSGTESSLSIPPRAKSADKPAVAAKPATKPKPVAKAKVTPKAPVAKAKPKTRAATKPKPVVPATPPPAHTAPKGDPVDSHGLPTVLAQAMRKHRVTVVALYDPQAAIDQMALAEARAGAASAHAGFVALNIRSEPQVRPLAQLLGVLESPSILVYERPNTLFVRVDGFSDRQTVAQAAANARR